MLWWYHFRMRKLLAAILILLSVSAAYASDSGFEPSYGRGSAPQAPEPQQALQQENYWNNQQLAQSIAQQDWENALTLMQILGYSDEQIAQVLGIAAGTQTDDAAYRAAQLELAMMGY